MEDLSKLSKQELIDRLNNQSVNQVSAESEFDKVQKLANKNDPNAIPLTYTSDHKNIYLYTALNKRIGPLHPENAKQSMLRFKHYGHQLYVKPRTEAEIEEYKKTDFYKKEAAKEEQTRKNRKSMTRAGQMEEFAKIISKETGVAVVNQISSLAVK